MILVIPSTADLQSQEFPSTENTICFFYSIPTIYPGITCPLADLSFLWPSCHIPWFLKTLMFLFETWNELHLYHCGCNTQGLWDFSSKLTRPFLLYLWIVTDLPFTVIFSCPHWWCCKFQSFSYLFPQIQKLSCLLLLFIVSIMTCPAYSCQKQNHLQGKLWCGYSSEYSFVSLTIMRCLKAQCVTKMDFHLMCPAKVNIDMHFLDPVPFHSTPTPRI